MAQKNSELIPQKEIDKVVSADKALTSMDDAALKLVKSIDAINESLKKANTTLTDLQKAQKKTEDNTKKAVTLKEKERLAEINLDTARKKAFDNYEKKQTQAAEATKKAGLQVTKAIGKESEYFKALKKTATAKAADAKITDKATAKEKAFQAALVLVVKSEKDLATKTAALTKKRYELDQTTKKGAAEFKRLTTAINKNNLALQKSQKSTGVATRGVGKYAAGIKSAGLQFAGALGLTSLVYLFVGAIKNSFSVLIGFEKQMAKVKAITGASAEDFKKLSDSAKELGANTLFKATEVAKLQSEYAKLGFTTREILAAQEATLNLAVATDTDLAEAAVVAGATLRGFGLDASEMNRVVDVMAKSFISSGLDITKFKETMKFVAPIAKAAGVSLEQTTIFMAKLADAGIHGSQAGTALKKIFSELSNDGRPVVDQLNEIAKSGLTLADAQDEVGERAKAALLVLTDGVGGLDKYTEAINNASGAGKEMAGVMEDTVAASATLLGSAWDGLILTMENSKGTMKSVLDFMTRTVDGVKLLVEFGFISPNKKWQAEQKKAVDFELSVLKEQKKIRDEFRLAEEKGWIDEGITFKQFVDNRVKQYNEQDDQFKSRNAALIKAYTDEANSAQLVADANDAAARKKALLDKKELEAIEKKALSVAKAESKLYNDRKDIEEQTTEFVQKQEDKKLKIRQDAAQKAADEAMKVVFTDEEEEIKDEDDFGDLGARLAATIEFAKKAAEEGQKQADIDVAILDDALANKLISEEEYAAAKESIEAKSAASTKEKILAGLALAQSTSDAIFNVFNTRLENEQTRLDTQRAARLKGVKSGSEEETRINATFDKKEITLKKKQDKAEQKQAIFKILLATAVGIASASPVIPLMILAGALGAIQLAVAASQPLPQYFLGTDSVPTDGPISIGEKGRELVEHNGKSFLVNNHTVASGLKGAKIRPNAETEMILAGGNRGDIQRIDMSEMLDEQRQTNKYLGKMGKMPTQNGYYDVINNKRKVRVS